ncbi:MAG: sulfite exporter TauE/SafE family protein [Syntrophales bacterium]
MDSLVFLSFAAGFLGGFGHCIGMCGPIVAAFALPAGQQGSRVIVLQPQLIYGAGRITAYAFVGALMGLSGTFVDTAGKLAGIQNLAAVLAGLFMVAAGLRITGLLRGPARAVWGEAGLLRAARIVAEADSVWKYFPLGILLGFIPCGLSYSLFIAAAGSGGVLPGMAAMISFGIGTLPAMLLFASLVNVFGSRLKHRLSVAGGIAVILMGVFFLSRAVRFYG